MKDQTIEMVESALEDTGLESEIYDSWNHVNSDVRSVARAVVLARLVSGDTVPEVEDCSPRFPPHREEIPFQGGRLSERGHRLVQKILKGERLSPDDL